MILKEYKNHNMFVFSQNIKKWLCQIAEFEKLTKKLLKQIIIRYLEIKTNNSQKYLRKMINHFERFTEN